MVFGKTNFGLAGQSTQKFVLKTIFAIFVAACLGTMTGSGVQAGTFV
jgi:hypothetical protein